MLVQPGSIAPGRFARRRWVLGQRIARDHQDVSVLSKSFKAPTVSQLKPLGKITDVEVKRNFVQDKVRKGVQREAEGRGRGRR